MKTTILALGLSFATAPTLAQVHVSVGVPAPPHPVVVAPPRPVVVVPPAPIITWAAPPPVVEVEPCIRVVEGMDDEVFFHDDYYWVRRDGHWWRTRDHRGGWVVAQEAVVPPHLFRVPHGHYRRYRHPHGASTVIVNPPGPHNAVKVKVKHH